MIIIFCEDPLNRKTPDEDYQVEAEAARTAGFDFGLINFEVLVYEKNAVTAVRKISQHHPEVTGIYRGWMLKPSDYASLYEALLEKGIRLINDPAAYKHCHYLPESYHVIKNRTPTTVWQPLSGTVDIDAIMDLLSQFGKAPVIVKDYVKSQKHYWFEACFIPEASNRAAVERVVLRFIELQDEDLNEGLVFREFVELESLTTHSKSGMPLTKEFRVFVYDKRPLIVSEYWEEGDYQGLKADLSEFADIMQSVQSRFFTMDIAKRENGEWIVMELGDGQVAGMSERIDRLQFYNNLAREITS